MIEPSEIRLSVSRLNSAYEIRDSRGRVIAWIPMGDLTPEEALEFSRLVLSASHLFEIINALDQAGLFDGPDFSVGHALGRRTIKRVLKFVESGLAD